MSFVRDSELSYFHQANQVGWIDDGLASINSLGLRGLEPAIPKPKHVLRIVVFGDSISFGWGVDDDETFCHLLQLKLNDGPTATPIEVVNAGVSGYATNQERLLLNRLAPQLQPDLVLVGFYWNDLLMMGSDHGVEAEASTVVDATEPLDPEDLHLIGSGRWWERLLCRSRAVFVAGRGAKALLGLNERSSSITAFETRLLSGDETPEIRQRWHRFEQELTDIDDLSAQHGFDVGIVVFPSRQQVCRDYPREQLQSKMRQLAEPLGFFVIDPLPAFRVRRDQVEELFIPYDRHHPSAAGHRLIADVIADNLRSHDRSSHVPR